MAKHSADGLYKRAGSPFWWGYRRRFPGGPLERASTKCRDRKAARTIKAGWERQAADPIHYASNQTTLGDAIVMFLDDAKRKGLAPPTLEMYSSKCRHIARVLDEGRKLNSVVATTWDGYISTREAEGAAPHSIKKELIRGLGVLKSAKRRGLYPHDLSTVMPTYAARYVPRTRALTMDELQRLGRELRADRLAHVAFVVATGCRLKESYRATAGHLLEEGFVFLDGTKTKRARRTIPIAPPLRPFLEFAIRNAPGARLPTAERGLPDEPMRAKGGTIRVRDGGNGTGRPVMPGGGVSASSPTVALFPRWHSARRDIHAACEPSDVPSEDAWGFSIEVEQVSWGHVARKKTWLYLVGIDYQLVVEGLRFGGAPTHWTSGGRAHSRKGSGGFVPPGIKVCSAQQRRRTPAAFAEWLISLAASSLVPHVARSATLLPAEAWRRRLPDGVTAEDVERDLAARAVGR